MRKILKLSSDDGDSGSKKYKGGYDGAYGGDWRSMRLAEIWQESGFSRLEDVFTFNLLCKEII
jgi:hypothetical protein